MKKFLHVVRVSYGNSSDCSKTDALLRQQDAEMLSNFSWNCLHFSEFLKKRIVCWKIEIHTVMIFN
jgi:hypothetical protein